jgi:hypothetical protein
VVGVVTEPDPDRAEDQVTELKPVPHDVFDPKQYRQIIETWVYPRPLVEVVRHPRDGKCFGTIRVSSRPDDDPYLVTRIPSEGSGLAADTGIGWPVRAGAHTSWTPVGQIHEAIRRAEAGLGSRGIAEGAEPGQPMDLQADLESIEAYMNWAERAFVWIAATPRRPQAVPIPGFYARDGVLGAVERPFELRYAGFGLTYGRVENQDGSLVSADGDERYLSAHPDGTALAACASGTGFLTRGGTSGRPVPEPGAVNPVVITEWTYLFCHLVSDVLAQRVDGPWAMSIGIRGANSRPWGLRMRAGQWSGRQAVFFGDGNPAGMDDWSYELEPQMDPSRDAYALLERLYEMFGLSVDDLEIVTNHAVDVEAIAALR